MKCFKAATHVEDHIKVCRGAPQLAFLTQTSSSTWPSSLPLWGSKAPKTSNCLLFSIFTMLLGAFVPPLISLPKTQPLTLINSSLFFKTWLRSFLQETFHVSLSQSQLGSPLWFLERLENGSQTLSSCLLPAPSKLQHTQQGLSRACWPLSNWYLPFQWWVN